MRDLHIHDCACEPIDRCTYCGCCQHCNYKCQSLCKVSAAPEGMPCPDTECGCVGLS